MPALQKLVRGFRAFRKEHYSGRDPHFMELVTKGQAPKVLMVACSDSRVDPAIMTYSEPGEIFMVRNVANLVPPYESDGRFHGTSAALDFGVRHLGVEHIVVMGHAKCGGIQALVKEVMDGTQETGMIGDWMRIVRDARDQVLFNMTYAPLPEKISACERLAISVSLKNLMSFPWIAERVHEGKLKLHGWFFDIEEGQLLCLDESSGQFRSVEEVYR